MSYNFYFISGGRNPASTIRALQQHPSPRPRPTLQLLDQNRPADILGRTPQEVVPQTEAQVAIGTTPVPRPQNRDILYRRAQSVRTASPQRHRSRRSGSRRRDRSRSPRFSDSSRRNREPDPPTDLPPGRWEDFPGVWQQPMVQVYPFQILLQDHCRHPHFRHRHLRCHHHQGDQVSQQIQGR